MKSHFIPYKFENSWDTELMKQELQIEWCRADEIVSTEECTHEDEVHIFLENIQRKGFKIRIEEPPRRGSLIINKKMLEILLSPPQEFSPDDGI